MANIIEDIMELRSTYLRKYYSHFVPFSQEFVEEHKQLENKSYVQNSQNNLLQDGRIVSVQKNNYTLKTKPYKNIKKHLAEILAGDMAVDEEWIQFLLEKYNSNLINEETFLVGSFIVFPGYSAIDEEDMISIMEKLSLSKDVQGKRIQQLAEVLGMPLEDFRKRTFGILIEHEGEYAQVKKVGEEIKKERILREQIGNSPVPVSLEDIQTKFKALNE